MQQDRNMVKLYNNVEDTENFLVIRFERDVTFSELVESYPEFANFASIQDDMTIEKGSSLFLDKNTGAIVLKLPNRDIVLEYLGKVLHVLNAKQNYVYYDGVNLYISENLSRDYKKVLFPDLYAFLCQFDTMESILPIDISKNLLMVTMGLLNVNDGKVIETGNNVVLFLQSFRRLVYDKLKLCVADKDTNELVGHLEVYLKKASEGNFSYSGNVQYKAREKFNNVKYASDVISTLVNHLDSVDDEYNKDLYIAMLVDDLVSEVAALENGGVLVHNGEAPDGTKLSMDNEEEEIKIYRISNK